MFEKKHSFTADELYPAAAAEIEEIRVFKTAQKETEELRKETYIRRLSLEELEDESDLPSPSLDKIRPELQAIKALAAVQEEEDFFGTSTFETSPGKASEDYQVISRLIRSFSSS